MPNLFEGQGDDLFAGLNVGDGVYPEPTEEDRRNVRRIVNGASLIDEITSIT